jgi:hypothetical protein
MVDTIEQTIEGKKLSESQKEADKHSDVLLDLQ